MIFTVRSEYTPKSSFRRTREGEHPDWSREGSKNSATKPPLSHLKLVEEELLFRTRKDTPFGFVQK